MEPKDIKNIYLIAICGTGMAGLAGLLKGSGYYVSGSDTNIYPPMSTLLENAGIPVLSGYRKENITDDIDLVIIGNAVSKSNEEVQAVAMSTRNIHSRVISNANAIKTVLLAQTEAHLN